jgi:hypothetical protein
MSSRLRKCAPSSDPIEPDTSWSWMWCEILWRVHLKGATRISMRSVAANRIADSALCCSLTDFVA